MNKIYLKQVQDFKTGCFWWVMKSIYIYYLFSLLLVLLLLDIDITNICNDKKNWDLICGRDKKDKIFWLNYAHLIFDLANNHCVTSGWELCDDSYESTLEHISFIFTTNPDFYLMFNVIWNQNIWNIDLTLKMEIQNTTFEEVAFVWEQGGG